MPDVVSFETIKTLIDEGPIGMTSAAKLLGTFRDGKLTRTPWPGGRPTVSS